MNVKSFASRVRELRQVRDLSQQDLARRLGVSRQTVFLVESGQSLPSLPLALKMASLFNQTIDKLIREDQAMHHLIPMSPFRGLRDLHEEIDRFFGEAMGPRHVAMPQTSVTALNVRQDEKNVYVEVAVPGFSADEIETEITDDYLTIRGQKKQEMQEKGKTWMRREFAFGSFERTIALPDSINADKADSMLKDGTLTITLPKSPQARPKVKKLKPKVS